MAGADIARLEIGDLGRLRRALDHDPTGFDAWLPGFPQAAERAGFTGVFRPAHPGALPPGVRTAVVPPGREAALIVVTPDKSAALCLQRTAVPGETDLVLTHDLATVLPLARMLLARLGTRIRRGPPPDGTAPAIRPAGAASPARPS